MALASPIFLAACAASAPAGGWSSPTVANGTVFFGGTNGKLYALDAGTGKLVWPQPYAGEQDKPLISVYSSPVVDNGIVYFGALDGYVYALDAASGAKKLAFDVNAESADKRGIVPSLLVDNGVIYFGANDHNFYALDVAKQALKWTFKTGDKVWGGATIADRTIYFGSFDHHLYALNLDGSKKWDYDAGGIIVSKPLVANGMVYFGALENLFALDAATGQVKWQRKLQPEHWVWSNPTIQDNVVYVGDLAGAVDAFDALTGEPKWAQPFEAGGQVRSSVTISNAVGYFGTASNKVFALDSKSGSVVWSFAADGPIYATPAVSGDVLYVNSHGRAYALSAANGSSKWCYDVAQGAVLQVSACAPVQ